MILAVCVCVCVLHVLDFAFRRILMFPKGNNVDFLSIYLDAADAVSLPIGWSRFAKFKLVLINQVDGKVTVKKGIFHTSPSPAPLLFSFSFTISFFFSNFIFGHLFWL